MTTKVYYLKLEGELTGYVTASEGFEPKDLAQFRDLAEKHPYATNAHEAVSLVVNRIKEMGVQSKVVLIQEESVNVLTVDPYAPEATRKKRVWPRKTKVK